MEGAETASEPVQNPLTRGVRARGKAPQAERKAKDPRGARAPFPRYPLDHPALQGRKCDLANPGPHLEG